MKDLLILFFLGIITACIALLLQIFWSIGSEVLLGTSFDLRYGINLTMHTTSLLLLGALSEEIIRYLIMSRYVGQLSRPIHFIWYGFSCGLGFGVTEIFMRTLDPAQQAFSPLMCIPLLIHIIASILIAYGIIRTAHSYIMRMTFLCIAITVHLCGNIGILLLLS